MCHEVKKEMERHPFLSIVTVVRNNLAGLKTTRESLNQQSCTDFEWLIIDGDSSDGTREFAFSCLAEKVKFISEPDRGIYDAMNKGLSLAQGLYIMFLNGGDSLATDKSLMELKRECLAHNPDVLFGSSMMDFGVMRIHRAVKSPDYIWHGQPGLHQATVFKVEKHLKFPYDLGYRVCADYDAITRMAHAGLTMRSAPILVSINEFNPAAVSGRKKARLMIEAVRAQRRNLRLSYAKISMSVGRRIFSETCAKALNLAQLLKGGMR